MNVEAEVLQPFGRLPFAIGGRVATSLSNAEESEAAARKYCEGFRVLHSAARVRSNGTNKTGLDRCIEAQVSRSNLWHDVRFQLTAAAYAVGRMIDPATRLV